MLNGCQDEFESEKYRVVKDMWELVPSYSQASDNEMINAYVGCLLKVDEDDMERRARSQKKPAGKQGLNPANESD